MLTISDKSQRILLLLQKGKKAISLKIPTGLEPTAFRVRDEVLDHYAMWVVLPEWRLFIPFIINGINACTRYTVYIGRHTICNR